MAPDLAILKLCRHVAIFCMTATENRHHRHIKGDITMSETAATDRSARKISHSRTAGRTRPAVELILVGGLVAIALDYLLGWGLFRPSSDYPSVTPLRPNRTAQPRSPNQAIGSGPAPSATPQNSHSQTTAPAANPDRSGTHRVICSAGTQGLNFRPSAGFSTPMFAIPCGMVVTVNGNSVTRQNETWSPVVYADRQGWVATKLLQPLR